MNKKVVFTLPYTGWVVSHLRGLPYDFATTYEELEKYNIEDRIVIDIVCPADSRNPPISKNTPKRVADYQNHFGQIILLNSDYIGIESSDIVNQCSRMDFPNVKLVTTGTIAYTPTAMTIVRYENFFADVQRVYERIGFDLLNGLRHTDTKPYYFDALLGLKKPHRDWIRNQISQSCEDKIYTTYYKNWNLPEDQIKQVFDWPEGASMIEGQEFASSNRVMYHGIDCNLSYIVPIEIYNKSAYSIVAETCLFNDFCLYTEKTAKPLLAKRLFVMFAGQHYLKNLRSLGFFTFNSVIDESYDNEPDNQRRWAMAFDQVQYLCGQDQRMVLERIAPLVEYNYKRFIETNWRYTLLD